jgi:hypothetical protein
MTQDAQVGVRSGWKVVTRRKSSPLVDHGSTNAASWLSLLKFLMQGRCRARVVRATELYVSAERG